MTDTITLPREVAELIENLMHHAYNDGVKQLKYRSSQTVEAEEALRTALAAEPTKPKPEPVAWMDRFGFVFRGKGPHETFTTPLYTAPPDAEALRRDAERYRWMKQEVKRIPPSWGLIGWDAAIDAAMEDKR